MRHGGRPPGKLKNMRPMHSAKIAKTINQRHLPQDFGKKNNKVVDNSFLNSKEAIQLALQIRQLDKRSLFTFIHELTQKHGKKFLLALMVAGFLTMGSEQSSPVWQSEPEQTYSQGAVSDEMESSAKDREESSLGVRDSMSDEEIYQVMREYLTENTHPLLLGHNVVFEDEWKQFIGEDGVISEENFATFRDRSDQAFQLGLELIGSHHIPHNLLSIAVENEDYFEREGTAAHYHRDSATRTTKSQICWRSDHAEDRLRIVEETGSWTFTQMHEIAHTFIGPWMSESESFANFIIAYIMEHSDAQFVVSEWLSEFDMELLGIEDPNMMIRGEQYRELMFRRAEHMREPERQMGALGAFASSARATHSGLDFFLYGIVNEAGWEPIKETFRSFNEQDFRPEMINLSWVSWGGSPYERNFERARDFIDRAVVFSGNPDLLQSLPHGQELLEDHFPIRDQFPLKISLEVNRPDGTSETIEEDLWRRRYGFRGGLRTFLEWEHYFSSVMEGVTGGQSPVGYHFFYNGRQIKSFMDLQEEMQSGQTHFVIDQRAPVEVQIDEREDGQGK